MASSTLDYTGADTVRGEAVPFSEGPFPLALLLKGS